MDKKTKVNLTEKVISAALNGFANSLKDGKSFTDFDSYKTENFYGGTGKFLKNPSAHGKWHLGYSSVDLVPDDILERPYFCGGYLMPEDKFCNEIKYVVDSMKARIIAIDDNSGRGLSVFCTVDCIGITNAAIRRIRKRFASLLSEKYPEKKICSVNVFSTHTHSCIDTQGLWTDVMPKMARNIKRNISGKGILEKGADEEFIRFLEKRVSGAMLEAVEKMKPGEMFIAQKDIEKKYFSNKNRPSATGLVTEITRLAFYPDDKNAVPTMIVNLPIHPDVAGLPTKDRPESGHELCGDYIYYMGETVNKAGFDFMFFNGAICAIYSNRDLSNDGLPLPARYMQSQRFGREMARIALSLTKSLDEIKKDKVLYDENEINEDKKILGENSDRYTLWCDGWEKVEEKKIKPLLNICIREVRVPVTNPIFRAAGKLNLADYKVLKEGKNRYSVFTEIGYIEFGKEFKVALVPGEYCPDLLTGGASLKAEGAAKSTDFQYPTLREIFGEDIYAFGLANDAVGYIVPDNDYTLGDPEDHYHEFVSLGKYAGSSINGGFVEMKKELDKHSVKKQPEGVTQ